MLYKIGKKTFLKNVHRFIGNYFKTLIICSLIWLKKYSFNLNLALKINVVLYIFFRSDANHF